MIHIIIYKLVYFHAQYWLYWKSSLSIVERVPPSTLCTSSYKGPFVNTFLSMTIKMKQSEKRTYSLDMCSLW